MADMNKAGTPKQAPIVPGFTPKQHVGVGGEILSAEPINTTKVGIQQRLLSTIRVIVRFRSVRISISSK